MAVTRTVWISNMSFNAGTTCNFASVAASAMRVAATPCDQISRCDSCERANWMLAARASETLNEPGFDQVSRIENDNRNGRRRALRRLAGRTPERDNQIDIARDQFGSKSGKALVLATAPAPIVDDGRAVGVSKVLEFFAQRCREASVCRLHPACEKSHTPHRGRLGADLL